MASTLRTLLTAAGCNVATATVVLHNGVGASYVSDKSKNLGANTNYAPVNPRQVTNGVDPQLDTRFYNGAGADQVPKCIAFDASAVYVLNIPATGDPYFMRVLLTSTNYASGAAKIPFGVDMPVYY
jgi:hypothetical protein